MADQLDLLGGLQPTVRASAPESNPRALHQALHLRTANLRRANPEQRLHERRPEDAVNHRYGNHRLGS
jgi:hypothetical protein